MEKITFDKWDSVELLTSQEDIDTYLNLAFQTGDVQHIKYALHQVKRAQTKLALPSIVNWTKSVDRLVEMAREFGYQLTFTPIKKSAR